MRKVIVIVLFFSLGMLISCADTSSSFSTYTLSGTITYDWIPALDNVTEGGVKLDYNQKTQKPARRVVVKAIDVSDNSEVAATTTNDQGEFSLSIPIGTIVKIRVYAWVYSVNYTKDGIGQDNCNGSSWDIRVVDNTNNKAMYAMETSSTYEKGETDISLNAPTTYSGGYITRTGAPYAILDTLVSEMELVCEGEPNINFPQIYVNWSPNNIAVSGDKSIGQITTSHFTVENGIAQLYILGKEDSDTDEYDDHVIAHEFGHYIENNLFRADSIGGSHGSGDLLDLRVAFGEGYGNGISGMVFNDPIYVDTSGVGRQQVLLSMLVKHLQAMIGVYIARQVYNTFCGNYTIIEIVSLIVVLLIEFIIS